MVSGTTWRMAGAYRSTSSAASGYSAFRRSRRRPMAAADSA